jgi:hypothetical protein
METAAPVETVEKRTACFSTVPTALGKLFIPLRSIPSFPQFPQPLRNDIYISGRKTRIRRRLIVIDLVEIQMDKIGLAA